jgi:predicted acylesterase/phospholipase RssA
MDGPRGRRLRADLPFRRIALVLSGGGALAAYEVGGLGVLERVGLKPAILAGVSSGAINAVLWITHGFQTERLIRGWRSLRASSIGMRWQLLAWRSVGSFLVGLALLELLLTVAGSTRFRLRGAFAGIADPDTQRISLLLEGLSWALIALLGLAMLAFARRGERWIARWRSGGDPDWRPRWILRIVAFGVLAHLITWVFGWPYPHRFSGTVLVVLSLIALAEHPGRIGQWIRARVLSLVPEGVGLGLWGSEARRRLVRRWMMGGDPSRLLDPHTHLIMSACDVDTGRMHYFVNWSDPGGRFESELAHVHGLMVPLRDVRSVVEAAVASSAVPMLFEPVEIEGRRFVDGGVFSNQPLHAVLADGADAMVVVLMSPGHGPSPDDRPRHLMSLGFRLLEIANWRDLQAELDGLPPDWTRADSPGSDPTHGDRRPAFGPARICVAEPDHVLPGGMYGYSNANARELMRRGEQDMWAALERAGWLEDIPADA